MWGKVRLLFLKHNVIECVLRRISRRVGRGGTYTDTQVDVTIRTGVLISLKTAQGHSGLDARMQHTPIKLRSGGVSVTPADRYFQQKRPRPMCRSLSAVVGPSHPLANDHSCVPLRSMRNAIAQSISNCH